MFISCFLVFVIFPISIKSCIPTQQVEITTTTTTTTTTTEEPFPCSICPPLYSPACLGGAVDEICSAALDVGLKYTVNFLLGQPTDCYAAFVCPLGTTTRIRELITGWIVPGPPVISASCSETGPKAGIWYISLGAVTTPVEVTSSTCSRLI